MKTFEINGKEYSGKPFDFNLVCDLEDMGVSVESMEEKPMSMVRGYIALCMGKRRADAGLEIQEHILNGGTMDDATKVMQEEMEQSDFFRNLNKRAEAEATKNQAKKNTGGRKTAAAK
jgi:hypothetical protein